MLSAYPLRSVAEATDEDDGNDKEQAAADADADRPLGVVRRHFGVDVGTNPLFLVILSSVEQNPLETLHSAHFPSHSRLLSLKHL